MDDKPKPNFFSHVFDFEKDSRSEMLNIAQYSVIAAVFVVLLNKAFDSYMPDNDPTKTAVALSFEVLLQCVLLFLGIVFIHRIISYIPTISGVVYAPQNVITVILPVLVVLLSSNTGIGRKVSLLVDKMSGTAKKPTKAPQQQQQQQQQQQPGLLPYGVNTSNPMGQSSIPTATPEPDFNSMFSGPTNSMVGAEFEPMPANMGGINF
jgi:hypothetical protein